MTEYIVVFDSRYKNPDIMLDSHYFMETFNSYQKAKEEAESWLKAGDCKGYDIFAICSNERNHII